MYVGGMDSECQDSSSGISQLRGSQDKLAESATGPAFGLDKWDIWGFGVICSGVHVA